MEFTNPEILPRDNAQALERFYFILQNQYADERTLLVVLGGGPEAQQLVNDAVALTGNGTFRGVVWAQKPDAIRPRVITLTLCPIVSRPDLGIPDRAFSLTVRSKIADVIKQTEPQPDNARIIQALSKAGGGC
jgi:hypothetical protein